MKVISTWLVMSRVSPRTIN